MRTLERFAGIVLGASLLLGTAAAHATTSNNTDQQIAVQLQREYARHTKLHGVKPSVSNQIVTLSGTVPNYRAELNAIHIAQQAPNVNGYITHLTVTGASVPDATLRREIARRLTYDRMGMGQTFNALTVKVDHGVVTVGGNVIGYASRDSALDIVADTKGVKRVIDHIKVAPLSPMDDQIRLEAAERIYGNPTLSKYATDPAHPIRIIVDNGRVTLIGAVDSKVDKQVAGSVVRSMPNVFKVDNDLAVVK